MATSESVADLAAEIVDAVGAAGGIDEVRRLAERGWPVSRDVEVATVGSRKYEDHDDCLAAAAADVAGGLGLEDWECTARWGDSGRDIIVVSSSSADLKAAIKARAASVVAEDGTMTVYEATIEERGNGFPDVGDYVPGDDGQLYRVVTLTRRIETGTSSGAANWMGATVEEADWDDCAEEDLFPAAAIIGVR